MRSTSRNRALASLLAFSTILGSCAQQPVERTAANPANPTPTSALGEPERAAATPVRAPAPQARGSVALPAPVATPVPAEKNGAPPAIATPALPAIYSVKATPSIVHGGDSVQWDVRTTPDIVSVVAHVAAITLPMKRIAAGHFALTFAVPNGVPFFFHGTYDMDVRALTPGGETLHRAVVLTFS